MGSDEEIPTDGLNPCLNCGGTGYNGHDRCYPPNPYICEWCGGTGRVYWGLWDIFRELYGDEAFSDALHRLSEKGADDGPT